jgi:hypothetical protein
MVASAGRKAKSDDFNVFCALPHDRVCPNTRPARACPGGITGHIMSDFQTQTRTVFFVSDGTGITAETLGHSLLAQFPEGNPLPPGARPFIDNIDKAIDCARTFAKPPPTACARSCSARWSMRPRLLHCTRPTPLPGPVRPLHRPPRGRARPALHPRGRPLPRHRRQPELQKPHRGDQLRHGPR